MSSLVPKRKLKLEVPAPSPRVDPVVLTNESTIKTDLDHEDQPQETYECLEDDSSKKFKPEFIQFVKPEPDNEVKEENETTKSMNFRILVYLCGLMLCEIKVLIKKFYLKIIIILSITSHGLQ